MRPLRVLITLFAVAYPLASGAQDPDAVARLRPGALVRFWEGGTSGSGKNAEVVERRGDSLIVKRDAITSGGVMIQRAGTLTLAWRTLPRLEVRGDEVKDSVIEGGVIGFFVGALIGALASTQSSGDIDLDSANGFSLGPVLFGGLGLLIGLGVDASKDNSPWITVVNTSAP